MSAKFPEYKGLNLPNVAKEMLEYWAENSIFEKSVTTREGNKPFVFFEGPPSANGLPGVQFYVAVTRAKDQLYLTYPMTNPQSYTGEYMTKPSRFLEAIPTELTEEWEVSTW